MKLPILLLLALFHCGALSAQLTGDSSAPGQDDPSLTRIAAGVAAGLTAGAALGGLTAYLILEPRGGGIPVFTVGGAALGGVIGATVGAHFGSNATGKPLLSFLANTVATAAVVAIATAIDGDPVVPLLVAIPVSISVSTFVEWATAR